MRSVELTGKRRDRAIKAHLEWLAGRMPSDAIRADAWQRLTALQVWVTASAKRRCQRKKRA